MQHEGDNASWVYVQNNLTFLFNSIFNLIQLQAKMFSPLRQVVLLAGVMACINAAVVRNSRGACPPFTSKPDFDYLQVCFVVIRIDQL